MAQRATGFAKKPPVARHDRVGNAGHGAGDDGERQAIALKLIQLIAPYKKNGRLAFRIERMPQLARLSAGRNNGNNSWSLTLDDLEGLTYLPPQGAGAHTLSLRIIGLEDGGSTLSVIELPVTPVEAEGDDAASDEYIQQLTDELDRVKAMLAEREQELERRKQERSQPADVKNIVDAEITSARTAWKLEMDQRLAAAAKDAAANLEAQKAAWNSEHSGRIAQSEEKTQSRIIEARERWRQEAKGALVQAESAWRAEEAQRFAAAEAQWRAKLAAAEAKAPADAKAGNELQTAREQLKALQAKLTERDGLLGELRAAGERAKTAARQELDTALRNAETNWRAGEASRLAASEAQWRVKLADAETKAAAKSDNGAAVELERARKDIATLKGQLTERETAFDNAEMARRADEAGRMSVLEAQWQTKTAEAEVKAAATARAGAANEAERSRNEIAALKVQLAERDAGLEKQWQAKIAEAEVKAAATARAGAANEAERGRNEIAALKVQLSERDTVHRNAESAWRTGEATRHAANEAQWQAKLADAQKTAKPSEDTGAKIAALESQLAERDKTLSELRATGSEAEALWKLEEARRLAAAQAEWQRLAEVNAADLQARCERAEAALAAAPVRVESANEGELRELRETLDLTKEILSQREAALAEAHGNIETLTAERNRLQTNAPLDGIAEYSALFPPPLADDANAGDQAIAIERAKAGWKLEEAKRLSDAETKWRDQAALGLADAKARYEAAEATLAQLRLRSERDQSDDNGDARIREKLVALQNALTARESEVSYARLLLERHNLLPPGADLQNLARRASGGKPAQNLSTAIYGLRWVLELGLVVLLAITAYIYLPRAITLMPYDWQENIATATNNVRTMLGQAPAKGAGSKDSTTVAAAGGATVTHSANLRMKPSGKATIATTLPRGAKVEAIQSKGSWTLVKAEGGLQGWVFSSYLDLTADADDAASPEKPTSKKSRALTAAAGRAELRYSESGAYISCVDPDPGMNSLKRWWPLAWRISAAVAVTVAAAVVLVFMPVPAPTHVPAPKAKIAVVHRVKHKTTPPVKLVVKTPPEKVAVQEASAFQKEQMMNPHQLLQRWNDDIVAASKRFGVSQAWIRAVMQAESGGRTMLAEGLPMTSSQGAMGLMQLMPQTYDDMRRAHRLGKDPFDPRDNILAGTAYLKFLNGKYGYPQMFAAYNDGPGNLEQRLRDGGLLPEETRNYLGSITAKLEGRATTGSGSGKVTFTRPNGEAVEIVVASVTQVRAALPNEYAPGVLTVIKTGRMKQGVREGVAAVTSAIRGRGGAI